MSLRMNWLMMSVPSEFVECYMWSVMFVVFTDYVECYVWEWCGAYVECPIIVESWGYTLAVLWRLSQLFIVRSFPRWGALMTADLRLLCFRERKLSMHGAISPCPSSAIPPQAPDIFSVAILVLLGATILSLVREISVCIAVINLFRWQAIH